MRKLVEWILYSLDIEMAQKLPIAVSCDVSQLLGILIASRPVIKKRYL